MKLRAIDETTVKAELQGFLDYYGLGISKEKLAEKAYSYMTSNGHECYILNGRYLGIDGEEYQMIKSVANNCWIAKGIR